MQLAVLLKAFTSYLKVTMVAWKEKKTQNCNTKRSYEVYE